MDNPPQTNLPETLTAEVVTPKPPVIATIESYHQAYIVWQEQESQRVQSRASEPIPKPDMAEEWDKLSDKASAARTACDDAIAGRTEAFDVLVSNLTADTPPTPEKIIQAGALLTEIADFRDGESLHLQAGNVLEKNPEALHLPDVPNAFELIIARLSNNVTKLRTAGSTKPDSPQYSNTLLEVATSETSPLEQGLKDQLRDTLDLVRGVQTKRSIDSLTPQSTEKIVIVSEKHLEAISQVCGVPLELVTLQNALNEHRKLLYDRKVSSSDNQPTLSQANFGEALAALSQRTEDPTQKRHLEALALGYAAAIERDPDYSQSEKASNVLMALVLDTKNPEISAYDTVHEGVKRPDDILAKLIPMVSDHSSNYRDSDIFSRQNEVAVHAKDARIAAEKIKTDAEKVQVAQLEATAKAEVDRLAAEAKAKAATPIMGPATVKTPPKNDIFSRIKRGFGL